MLQEKVELKKMSNTQQSQSNSSTTLSVNGKGRGRGSNKSGVSRNYPRGIGLDFRKLSRTTLMSYIDHHGEYLIEINDYKFQK